MVLLPSITQLNASLTANSQTAQLTYKNGKYGFTINGTFYEIGGGAMPILDYANPLHIFTGAGSYTTTKDCWLGGSFMGDIPGRAITIDGQVVFYAEIYNSGVTTSSYCVNLPWTKVKAGSTITVTGANFTGANVLILSELTI